MFTLLFIVSPIKKTATGPRLFEARAFGRDGSLRPGGALCGPNRHQNHRGATVCARVFLRMGPRAQNTCTFRESSSFCYHCLYFSLTPRQEQMRCPYPSSPSFHLLNASFHQKVVESAVGGMLFVDEAYALVKDSKDSFGKEALDTLIKLVEDKRDELVVVLAGYVKATDGN